MAASVLANASSVAARLVVRAATAEAACCNAGVERRQRLVQHPGQPDRPLRQRRAVLRQRQQARDLRARKLGRVMRNGELAPVLTQYGARGRRHRQRRIRRRGRDRRLCHGVMRQRRGLRQGVHGVLHLRGQKFDGAGCIPLGGDGAHRRFDRLIDVCRRSLQGRRVAGARGVGQMLVHRRKRRVQRLPLRRAAVCAGNAPAATAPFAGRWRGGRTRAAPPPTRLGTWRSRPNGSPPARRRGRPPACSASTNAKPPSTRTRME